MPISPSPNAWPFPPPATYEDYLDQCNFAFDHGFPNPDQPHGLNPIPEQVDPIPQVAWYQVSAGPTKQNVNAVYDAAFTSTPKVPTPLTYPPESKYAKLLAEIEELEKSKNQEMNIQNTKLSKIIPYSVAQITPINAFVSLQLLCENLKERIPSDLPTIEVGGDTLVGIEIEVENSLYTNTGGKKLNDNNLLAAETALCAVWHKEKDDSLKKAGAEYITKVGLKAHEAPAALALLHRYFEVYMRNIERNYRCGTHVHVDVRNFTVEQFINLAILYSLFESTFYRVSGERYRNIFCVPLRGSSSNLEKLIALVSKEKPTFDNFRSIFRHFKKYMAFNLLPAGRLSNDHHQYPPPLGTIEFRHHEGASDPKVLTKWLKTILAIHTHAQSIGVKELLEIVFNLNTVSNYMEFAKSVFGRELPRVTVPDLVDDMYEGSSYVKELYVNSKGDM